VSLEVKPLTNIVSDSGLASEVRENESKVRPVSGRAEMWSGITYGSALLGCCSLAKLFWPESEPIEWLFMLIAASVWMLGCRLSGLLRERYDFRGRFAGLKRCVAGGIGFSALWSIVYFRDVRPRFTLGQPRRLGPGFCRGPVWQKWDLVQPTSLDRF